MQSRWNDAEAETFVARYAAEGRDLALRVYSSRLIGMEEDLVLHGGGNTSVKTTTTTLVGDEIEEMRAQVTPEEILYTKEALDPHA